jgi:hypothetical protein
MVSFGLAVITFAALIAVLEVLAPFNGLYKLLAFVFCVIFFTRLSRRWAASRVSDRVAASIVAEGLCGCCGQSLRSLPVEADGCVQCAECGAAWRWQRVTRPYWQATPAFRDDVDFVYRLFGLVPRKRKLMTADDRGRYVRAMDSWLILMSRTVQARYTTEQRRRLRRAARRVGRALRLGMVALSIAFAGAMAATVWLTSRDPDALIAVSAVMAVFLVFTVPTTLLGHAGYHPARVARALARLNVCGCCGSPLEGEVESDGCKVCTCCGSAWKSPASLACTRCGYALNGLEAQPGRDLLCPECGEVATIGSSDGPPGGKRNGICG